jgi:hypothetical protein
LLILVCIEIHYFVIPICFENARLLNLLGNKVAQASSNNVVRRTSGRCMYVYKL